MQPAPPKLPFEASFDELQADTDAYVSSVFSLLKSDFLQIPKGKGFIEYSDFEKAYEVVKKATGGFDRLDPDAVVETVISVPLTLVVLRTMLGFTPSELAYVANLASSEEVTQGFTRGIDRKIRLSPFTPLKPSNVTRRRLQQLIAAACRLLTSPPSAQNAGMIHRLDKADTRQGIESVRSLAHLGALYAMVLYERFLGRPFAGHRDSVSELIGDVLELAIEDVLSKAGISYRKTKRADKILGFDQAPDFVIPSEFNPQVVIEAKMTEDDGTARDKVTRIQHLGELSRLKALKDEQGFEVIACTGGRCFRVRRSDMRKLLIATRGKVFTLNTLNRLVECSRLTGFATMVQSN